MLSPQQKREAVRTMQNDKKISERWVCQLVGHWQSGNGTMVLTRAQFDALILGLPWARLADGGGALR